MANLVMGIFLAFLATFCVSEAGQVSDNCLYGRTDPGRCCQSIPNGEPAQLANPTDCTKYYICRNNQPVSYTCDPSSVFNVSQGQCTASDDTSQCPQKQ